MDRAQLLALLSEALAGMREDVALMKVGSIKCLSFGNADVTAEIIGRVQQRVGKLESVAAVLGRQTASD